MEREMKKNQKAIDLICKYVEDQEARERKYLKGKHNGFVIIPNEILRHIVPRHLSEYGGQLVRDAIYLWSVYYAHRFKKDKSSPIFGTCFLNQEQVKNMTGIRRERQAKLNQILIEMNLLKIVKMHVNGHMKNYYIPLLPNWEI